MVKKTKTKKKPVKTKRGSSMKVKKLSRKKVYFFGNGKAEGKGTMKNVLGGKGANLAEMTNLNIPVPPGLTITTDECIQFTKNGGKLNSALKKDVIEKMKRVEKVMGKQFGDVENPLLLSVRSGARVSMPGMMDTILNLGLNSKTVQGLAAMAGDERFAYDSYRRFIQMYSNVVLDVDMEHFEHLLEAIKLEHDVEDDTELKSSDWKLLVEQYLNKVKEMTGKEFPSDPLEQLWGAISAVFQSWNNKRAIEYRRINEIADDWGTAVNVQSMVFGNMGESSSTGVAFTRDPSSGDRVFFGEYLVNAQGEDVVAGIRTPSSINVSGKRVGDSQQSMEEKFPKIYKQLESIYKKLEKHYRDMQDIEFTVENDKLWMLQTRSGKRTARAAIKIATAMVKERLISQKEAILRIVPEQLDQLLHPTLDPRAEKQVIARALPASPGAASGRVVFTCEDVVEEVGRGNKVIMVRLETSPEDIKGMHLSQGILTARGGMTSHAAVVARGMGRCCVVGCGELVIDSVKESFTVGDTVVQRGDWITLDGSTGEVILGQVATVKPEISKDFSTLMRWVDQYRKLKVRTNADTPVDAKTARSFGAEGIGLCRTEHMFFAEDRVKAVREMILAADKEGREKALAKIEPMQKSDFKGIFKEMKGLPVTIRLLDPPLHEFLPHTDEELRPIAESMGVDFTVLKAKVNALKEFNPMLGHRGCRLGVSFPEIYDMQVKAIMEAACELVRDEKYKITPEIMVPLVGHVNELKIMRERAEIVCKSVIKEYGVKIKYLIGTMIELPRAAITADEIAEYADFFSCGTNDLTQTTFGLSRDDSQKFLPQYVEQKILPNDPFVSLDRNGVGELIKIGVRKGLQTKPNLKVGICGEHGGDPQSVEFCHLLNMNYVSCSPYRVPVAKLSAAIAALKNEKSKPRVKK
jgi:pyruvate, orthophosphate dikinase